MDVWIISNLGDYEWNHYKHIPVFMWTYISFLWSKYIPRCEILGHCGKYMLNIKKVSKLFQVGIPISSVWELQLLCILTKSGCYKVFTF